MKLFTVTVRLDGRASEWVERFLAAIERPAPATNGFISAEQKKREIADDALELVLSESPISSREVSHRTGHEMRAVRQALTDLMKRGLLKRIGRTSTTRWMPVGEGDPDTSDLEVARRGDQQKQVFEAMTAAGAPISLKDLEACLDGIMTLRQIGNSLARLKRRGLAEVTQRSSHAAKWLLVPVTAEPTKEVSAKAPDTEAPREPWGGVWVV